MFWGREVSVVVFILCDGRYSEVLARLEFFTAISVHVCILMSYWLWSPLTCLLTYLLQGVSPSLEANRFSASKNSPYFMEPQVSLPHSQVPATCPCPKPDQSSPWPSPHSTSWRFFLILSSHLRLGIPSGLFPLGFPTKTLYTPLLSPYVLHAPPISFFSIWSLEQYCERSTMKTSTLLNVYQGAWETWRLPQIMLQGYRSE